MGLTVAAVTIVPPSSPFLCPLSRWEGWLCSGMGTEGRHSSWQACGGCERSLKSKTEKHPHGDQGDLVLQEEVTQMNTEQRVPWVPLPSPISQGTVQSCCSCRPLANSPALLQELLLGRAKPLGI